MPKIIIASGPVIVEKGKVLLNKHGDDNFWKFCGGKVEDFDFNLQESARRELKEEMGLDMELKDTEPFIMHTQKDGDTDVILVHYHAKAVGEPKPAADIKEWKWVPLKDLEALAKKGELAPNIEPALIHFWYLDK